MRGILMGLAMLAIPIAAQAAPVIDQSTLIPLTGGFSAVSFGVTRTPRGNAVNFLQQSVTAGLTGQLTQLDLQVVRGAGTGGFNFWLLDGTSALSPVVYSTGFAIDRLPTSAQLRAGEVFSIDLSSAAFNVTAGQQFSFVLAPGNPPTEVGGGGFLTGSIDSMGTMTRNEYAGGQLTVSSNGVTYVPVSGDGGFRTFVDAAAAVPEPATWALLMIGFGAVGATLRTRRDGARLAFQR